MNTWGSDSGGFSSALRADAQLAWAHWILKSYASRAETADRGTVTSQEPSPLGRFVVKARDHGASRLGAGDEGAPRQRVAIAAAGGAEIRTEGD
jgi:hypothetical protein